MSPPGGSFQRLRLINRLSYCAVILDREKRLGAYPESANYQTIPPVGAASSRDHFISLLEAAPTTKTTCSFQITGKGYS